VGRFRLRPACDRLTRFLRFLTLIFQKPILRLARQKKRLKPVKNGGLLVTAFDIRYALRAVRNQTRLLQAAWRSAFPYVA
jgi:hypothetical protein